MQQSKILVDTNSYIRLAQTIRPLLFVPFGDNQYCLYILPELNDELANQKLQTKFPWVNEEEFQDNRDAFPNIGRKQRRAIDTNFEFMWDAATSTHKGPSRVDVRYLAVALELDIPVITDDQDMKNLAKEFEVEVMSTLELLKIMKDCGHVDMSTIEGLIEYWQYMSDMPANFKRDYKRQFSNEPA